MDKFELGEVFTIIDDEEHEHEVEVLAELNIEGTEYAAVGFVEEMAQIDAEEDLDIFFVKLDQQGHLEAVQTDDEFKIVSQAFDEMLEHDHQEDD